MRAQDRLRVVHLTHGLDMGGQEKLLVEFARHGDRARFDLLFVSLGSGGVIAPEIEACGWPVVHLAEPTGFRPGLIVRLARLFGRWGADVVHTHEDRPLIHGVPAAYLAGAAVIHTRHGQSPGLTRRRTVLINLAARLTARFVCVSHDSARSSVARGVSPARALTIWNGIDLEHYSYSGPCAAGPAVCVARLSPEKGVATLIRAAALVVRAAPDFRLEIAGDGPCLADLRRLIAELGLSNRVRLLGQVRDISGLLARASLFVLPSLSEGLSLTVLEAMARGLPVVATRVGGNVEAVLDGQTGLLVPPDCPTELAAALLRVRRDPGMAQTLGWTGRLRVEKHFDIRHMLAAYQGLYRAACRRPSRLRESGSHSKAGTGFAPRAQPFLSTLR